MLAFLKRNVPWWLRISAKLILARLPFQYSFWKKLGLFEHGDMDQPSRALESFLMHAVSAGVVKSDGQFINSPAAACFSLLELGPGDSLFDALIAKSLGATESWFVDAGPYATTEVPAYRAMVQYLKGQRYPVIDIEEGGSFDGVLSACNARYLTNGVASLASIPNESLDFSFSNAVLEHVPKAHFDELARHLYRTLKRDGVSIHRVDLKDHLGGGLQNLRFSESLWESRWFSSSGFYTNRIRYVDMLAIFRRAGFECEVLRKVTWATLPMSRDSMAKEFAAVADEDLLVSGFDVLLKKAR